MKPSAKDVQDAQDREDRLDDEREILRIAHELTNGCAGDQKMTGEVLEWLVKQQIHSNAVLRTLVSAQTQATGKRWFFEVFGATYSLP